MPEPLPQPEKQFNIPVVGNLSPSKAELLLKSAGMVHVKPKIFTHLPEPLQKLSDKVLKPSEPLKQTDKDYSGTVKEFPKPTQKASTHFGQVYDTTFKFLAGSYVREDGVTISYEDFEELSTLMSISQTKNIIKTIVQGRNGSVKEYNSLGDYEISLNMVITNNEGESAPLDKIALFRNILESNDAIGVYAPLLQALSISTVVINNADINEIEGTLNTYSVRLSMSSDEPLEVRLTQ